MGKQKKVEFIESYIKIGDGDYQWHDCHGELIRCKNCMHFEMSPNGEMGLCKIGGVLRRTTFYCADGENI